MFTLQAPGRLDSLAFSPDGTRLAATGEGVVHVWDLAGRSLVLTDQTGWATARGVFFADADRLAVLAEGRLSARDLSRSGWQSLAPPGRAGAVAPMPSGRLLCLLEHPAELGVFLLPALAPVWVYAPPVPVAALASSPDGTHAALAERDGTVRLLDAGSGDELHAWFCGSRDVAGLAVAPGGRAVACRAGQFLHFHRMPPGGESDHHRLNAQHFTGLAWHPSGDFFATTKGDGNADFWDGHDGERRQSFGWGAGALTAIAFDPSGDLCAATSEDGRVIVWDVDR
ncbi:MAG: WD40 repeat domain-containing protein [Gemmataceae bacterium]|nr:WD40 repeat domain-containing protein [Gemmataceae bacterium]